MPSFECSFSFPELAVEKDPSNYLLSYECRAYPTDVVVKSGCEYGILVLYKAMCRYVLQKLKPTLLYALYIILACIRSEEQNNKVQTKVRFQALTVMSSKMILSLL
jgi:hypothetical protein